MSICLSIDRSINHVCAVDWCTEQSPGECKLEWIQLKAEYSAGMLVKVTNGMPTRKVTESNSCPLGWKIWSPQNKADMIAVRKSTSLPADPHAVVDVIRKSNNHCTGCVGLPMNSGVSQMSSWQTLDGSAWWLSDIKHEYPNGKYGKYCYLQLKSVTTDGDITFADGKPITLVSLSCLVASFGPQT